MVGVTFLELSIWSTRRISFAGGQTSVFDPWPLCLNPYPAARAAVVPLRGWWPPLVGAALQCSKHNAAGAASPSRSLCAPHGFIPHHHPLYISYFTQAHLFKLIASSFYFIKLQSCHGGTLKLGSIFCAHSQIEAPNSWKRTDVGIHSNNAVLSGNIWHLSIQSKSNCTAWHIAVHCTTDER